MANDEHGAKQHGIAKQLPVFQTLPQMMFGVCAVPAAVAGASSSVDVDDVDDVDVQKVDVR